MHSTFLAHTNARRHGQQLAERLVRPGKCERVELSGGDTADVLVLVAYVPPDEQCCPYPFVGEGVAASDSCVWANNTVSYCGVFETCQ